MRRRPVSPSVFCEWCVSNAGMTGAVVQLSSRELFLHSTKDGPVFLCSKVTFRVRIVTQLLANFFSDSLASLKET